MSLIGIRYSIGERLSWRQRLQPGNIRIMLKFNEPRKLSIGMDIQRPRILDSLFRHRPITRGSLGLHQSGLCVSTKACVSGYQPIVAARFPLIIIIYYYYYCYVWSAHDSRMTSTFLFAIDFGTRQKAYKSTGVSRKDAAAGYNPPSAANYITKMNQGGHIVELTVNLTISPSEMI